MGNNSLEWSTCYRHYRLTDYEFEKRELYPNEKLQNVRGEIIEAPFSRELLENEYHTLTFISKNTAIPVPEVVRFGEHDGVLVLVTKRVNGVTLHNIEDCHYEEACQNACDFVENHVLPELQKHTSYKSGSLAGVVLPPRRVMEKDSRLYWPQRISDREEFVFCHNDLAQQNIMIDPETLKPVAIIDWESAGFYPAIFEAKLWKTRASEQTVDEAEVDALVEFLAAT